MYTALYQAQKGQAAAAAKGASTKVVDNHITNLQRQIASANASSVRGNVAQTVNEVAMPQYGASNNPANEVKTLVNNEAKEALDTIITDLPTRGTLDKANIDFTKISSNKYDAQAGDFIDRNKIKDQYFGDDGELTYKINDNGTIKIMENGEVLGYTTIDGAGLKKQSEASKQTETKKPDGKTVYDKSSQLSQGNTENSGNLQSRVSWVSDTSYPAGTVVTVINNNPNNLKFGAASTDAEGNITSNNSGWKQNETTYSFTTDENGYIGMNVAHNDDSNIRPGDVKDSDIQIIVSLPNNKQANQSMQNQVEDTVNIVDNPPIEDVVNIVDADAINVEAQAPIDFVIDEDTGKFKFFYEDGVQKIGGKDPIYAETINGMTNYVYQNPDGSTYIVTK